MEPLSDKELSQILEQWKAPGAPPNLETPRLPQAHQGWWRWLMTGSIRIPVPVGVAILIALLLWAYSREGAKPIATPTAKPVSLSDFEPVKQLQPRVIGRANEGN
jgi:hypothetical protein